MSENTALWDRLGKTDPSHTKSFKRAGGFSGTAIKPMWSYRSMTEEFGPCGVGWGINAPTFQVVPAGDEVLVYCTVSVWYSREERGDGNKPFKMATQNVYGVGGDKVVNKTANGLRSDDEAFKKAFTDAVTNALKLIGVGADVHMGLFDDNKYVNTMKQEFAEEPARKQEAAKLQQAKPISSAENKRQLAQIDNELVDCRTPGDVTKLLNFWADEAEKAGWSSDYWNEARRRFARRKKELEEADDTVSAIQDQFTGATVTNERLHA